MKRTDFAAAFITIGMATVTFAQAGTVPTSANNAHHSNSELHQREREAHTPAQYHALADYYAQQKASYQHQADVEKQEWERRSLNVTGPAAKPPRPVDSAKNLYEYYAVKADHAGSLASHYRQLEVSSEPIEHN